MAKDRKAKVKKPRAKKNTKQIKVSDYVRNENMKTVDTLKVKSSIEMKEHISKLSLDVVSKASDQGKKLKELYGILEDPEHGKTIILRKSVIVSLCLVYKDILPSYKITVLAEEQKEQSMKKETVKMYSEEELLLGHYQRYVKLIESVLLKKFNVERLNFIKWTETDELTMLKCACEMYLCRPNFNLSQTLLMLIIPYLNSTDKKFLKVALNAVERCIAEDLRGDVTLKICEEIKKIATNMKFVFRSTLLKPLMSIDLEEMDLPENETGNNRNKNNFSRKQKKSFKKNKKLNEEKDELNAKESLDTKAKYNSQILRTIFYVYFQVLKQRNISSKLLEIVLDSIQKFGRLIDCKMFPDTFTILTKLCDNTTISTANRLRSVYVALSILTSGKASDILEIDPVHYCHKLLSIGEKDNHNETNVILIINCCTKILMKRRNQNAIKDVEKLIKMLIGIAWKQKALTYLCAFVILSTVRYIRVYPKLQFMFDEEDDEMPEEFKQVIKDNSKKSDSSSDNKTLSNIKDLCNVNCLEVSSVAIRIKKFFKKSENENSLLGLNSSLEELTKLKTKECIETLKVRCQKKMKRINEESPGVQSAKKAKVEL